MDSQPQRQSSVILGLRAFIMLAGLVAVPLAAIFGSSLPNLVRELGSERQDEVGEPVVWNTAIRSSHTEAPRFGPLASHETPQSPETHSPETHYLQARQDGGNAAPVALAPLPPLQTAPVRVATQQPAGTRFAEQPPPSTAIAGGSQPGPPGPERFTWMERRLRELGATYYLLEAWGSDGGLFRFHCKMAIAGNDQLNRHFEATDPDPLRAMERVLTQVEAWRAGPQIRE
ncbi:MAG: hypothetical protein HY000_28715 [Planctomycetes bacterium]|nr:hypothetical protein [Planctomycetota bacterium]